LRLDCARAGRPRLCAADQTRHTVGQRPWAGRQSGGEASLSRRL